MRESFWLIAAFAAILATTNASDNPLLPVPTECPSVDSVEATVHLAHESDCSKFYVCFLGEKILKDCPYRNAKGDRLHFNPVLQICDFPENANCRNENEVTTDESSENGNEQSPTVSTIESIDPSDPTVESTYPSDPTVESSDPTTSSEAPPSPKPGNVSNECPPDNSGIAKHLPHESKCSSYYKCDAGRKVEQSCPPGLAFNAQLEVCDYPENVNCPNEVNVAKSGNLNLEEVTTEIPTECPPNNSGGLVQIPHETNCSLFYKCDKGEKVIHMCPPPLIYNPSIRVCDFRENVNCTDKVNASETENLDLRAFSSSNATVPPPPEVPTECPPDNTGNAVQLPHETNCSLFYKCDEGEKVVQHCPPGLVFNPPWQVCDFPENVDCVDKVNASEAENLDLRAFSSSNATVPPPPEVPTECPPDNTGNAVQLPHETNCSLFYKCDEGEKVVQHCPPGLVFNPPWQVCDFPENVDCVDKVNASDAENLDLEESGGLIQFLSNFIMGNNSSQETTESPASCIESCPDEDPANYTIIMPNKDCNKYCMCSNGQAIVRRCPPGFHFDRVEKVCNRPHIAKCVPELAIL